MTMVVMILMVLLIAMLLLCAYAIDQLDKLRVQNTILQCERNAAIRRLRRYEESPL